MIKIILCVVISLICAAFTQNEDYFYTTDRNKEWSSKSNSSSSWVNRLSEKEKYIKWQACYKNAFFVDTNKTRFKTFECLDLLAQTSQLPDVIFINSSSEEFSINTTLLSVLTKTDGLSLNDFRILQFFFKVIPHRVLVKILEDVVKIVSDAIDVKQLSHKLCRIFVDFLLNVYAIDNHLAIIAPKLVVATWRPFFSNFTGVLWIKTVNDGVENQMKRINCTSYSELSQLNVNRTEMRACVHPLFLNELGLTLSEEEKKKLYVVLILSTDNPFFAKYFYGNTYYTKFYNGDNNRVVGFSIPEYCKQIYQPLLNISFDGMLNNVFGKEYFDPSDLWYKDCSVSKMVFVDRVQTIKNSTIYYESVKEEYCLEETTIEGFNKVHWSQTPLFSMGYPDSFCVDSNYNIPSRRCLGYGFANDSHVECSRTHLLSSYSKIFYEYATKCKEFKNFSMILQHFNSIVLNELDQNLYLKAIECISSNIYVCFPYSYDHWCDNLNTEIQQNLDLIHATMNKGIDIAYKMDKSSFLGPFMYVFIEWIQNHWMREGVRIYPRYIYYKQERHPFQMIIFKEDGNYFSNYRVEASPKEIDTIDEYIFDTDAEVIISINSTFYSQSVTILVLYDNLFPTYGFVCRSRTVVVTWNQYDFNLIMKIYFKIINFNDNQTMISHTEEGHWIVVPNITFGETHVAIYEKNDNYCIGEKFAIIDNWFSKKETLRTKKQIQESIDLLSAVSFSINTADTIEKIKQIYHKHMFTFNILRHTGGTLSAVGIFIIFSTTLTLKGWHKTRFNIIQLTTTLASQMPFFLLNMEVSHVKILIFYYCILCQFSCTCIIGYVQYTKYIAVFKNRPVGRLKSLIIGWVIPLTIILSSLFFYGGCLKCHLCHKNKEIFMFFVFVPIVTIIVGNSIVYIVAMINIWSSPKLGSHDIRLKIKVSIFLPCVLGITWIFIAALVAPWSWLTLLGLFLIHLVLPSQGFLLFIFVILLEKGTRNQWKSYLISIRRKRINPAIELN